jgi:S1-C subfamily serine protease
MVSMSETQWHDGFAAAVEAARASTLRVASGRCGSTSGTVLTEELLVTSQHALRNAEEARVFDDAGVERHAHVVGVDAGSDLALLKVEPAGLQKPRFAAHESLRVGQLTLALGRPGASIRASLRIIGLLSGEQRTSSGGRLEHYIETDRGFPDGFVGGPLVNAQGEVIGMNSDALLRGSDLALPHVTLERVAAELLAHGRVRRGYLGVATQPLRLPASLRETLGQRGGVLVLDTDEGGPARAAGLAFGDVIVAIDEQPVRGPRELSAALADKLGVAVTLRLVRAGKLETLQVTTAVRS